MKEGFYELRKVFQFRSIQLAILLFFALNLLCCFIETGYSSPRAALDEIQRIFQLASEYPDEIQDVYTRFSSSDRQELWDIAVSKHLSDSASTEAFYVLFDTIDSILTFQSDIIKVIKKAESNLAELRSRDMAPDSYAVRLQEKYIDVYSTVAERVELGFEYPHGWNVYFSDTGRMICSIAVVFVCSSFLFTHEYASGFSSILRTTRRGRFQTSCAKQFCLFCISASTVLLFSLSSFLVIGLRIGYSSPHNAIQSIHIFRYCPLVLTIGQYFFYSIVFQILVIYTFSLFLSAVSVITNRYTYIYLCGIGFIGFHVVLYLFNYVSYDSPLKWLNFISSVLVSPLFYQYRACNLFGYPISCQAALIAVYTISLLVLSLLISLVYCLKRESRRKVARHRAFALINRIRNGCRTKKKSGTTHSLSVTFYESLKLFVVQKQWLLLLCLFLIHIYLLSASTFTPITFSEAVYKDYMTRYEGSLSSDKAQKIQKERHYINKTLSSYESMRISYLEGTLSKEAYDSFLKEYRYASGRDEIFRKIEEHMRYIEQLAREGKEAYFVYDSGWDRILFSDFQWTLYAAILLVSSSAFTIEYDSKTSEGNFSSILRCCKKGRAETWRAKYRLSVIYAMLLSLVWNSTSIWITAMQYALPLPDAPVFSIARCYALPFHFSIFQTVLLIVSLRILSITLFSVFTVTVSGIFKKAVPVLTAAAGATLLPSLPELLSVLDLYTFSYVAFLKVAPALISHTYFPMLCVFLLIMLFLIIYAKRSWIN